LEVKAYFYHNFIIEIKKVILIKNMKNQSINILIICNLVSITFQNTIEITNEHIKENDSLFLNFLGYKVKKIINRPNPVYTQGLFFDNSGDHIYESGGLYEKSTIKKLKYPSLEIEFSIQLESKYFAEGIAKCEETVYQLTWKDNAIFKYDLDDLEVLGKISMDKKMKEGWGLAEYKNGELIATDGSSKIYFLNCNKNIKLNKIIEVTMNKIPLNNLNALVFAKGYIFANVYFE